MLLQKFLDLTKFPGADEILTSQMKSVGEVMAIDPHSKNLFKKQYED